VQPQTQPRGSPEEGVVHGVHPGQAQIGLAVEGGPLVGEVQHFKARRQLEITPREIPAQASIEGEEVRQAVAGERGSLPTVGLGGDGEIAGQLVEAEGVEGPAPPTAVPLPKRAPKMWVSSTLKPSPIPRRRRSVSSPRPLPRRLGPCPPEERWTNAPAGSIKEG